MCPGMSDYEVVVEELSLLAEKMRGLEERLAEVERVNARLEEASLAFAHVSPVILSNELDCSRMRGWVRDARARPPTPASASPAYLANEGDERSPRAGLGCQASPSAPDRRTHAGGNGRRIRLRRPGKDTRYTGRMAPSSVWRFAKLPTDRGARASRRAGGTSDPYCLPHVPLPQTPLPAPVGVHDVDRVAAVAVTDEGDLPPIGRPGRIAVVRQVARQPPLPAPVGVHEVDLGAACVFAGEGDLLPVGRPGRRGVGFPAGFGVRFRTPLPSAFTT